MPEHAPPLVLPSLGNRFAVKLPLLGADGWEWGDNEPGGELFEERETRAWMEDHAFRYPLGLQETGPLDSIWARHREEPTDVEPAWECENLPHSLSVHSPTNGGQLYSRSGRTDGQVANPLPSTFFGVAGERAEEEPTCPEAVLPPPADDERAGGFISPPPGLHLFASSCESSAMPPPDLTSVTPGYGALVPILGSYRVATDAPWDRRQRVLMDEAGDDLSPVSSALEKHGGNDQNFSDNLPLNSIQTEETSTVTGGNEEFRAPIRAVAAPAPRYGEAMSLLSEPASRVGPSAARQETAPAPFATGTNDHRVNVEYSAHDTTPTDEERHRASIASGAGIEIPETISQSTGLPAQSGRGDGSQPVSKLSDPVALNAALTGRKPITSTAAKRSYPLLAHPPSVGKDETPSDKSETAQTALNSTGLYGTRPARTSFTELTAVRIAAVAGGIPTPKTGSVVIQIKENGQTGIPSGSGQLGIPDLPTIASLPEVRMASPGSEQPESLDAATFQQSGGEFRASASTGKPPANAVAAEPTPTARQQTANESIQRDRPGSQVSVELLSAETTPVAEGNTAPALVLPLENLGSGHPNQNDIDTGGIQAAGMASARGVQGISDIADVNPVGFQAAGTENQPTSEAGPGTFPAASVRGETANAAIGRVDPWGSPPLAPTPVLHPVAVILARQSEIESADGSLPKVLVAELARTDLTGPAKEGQQTLSPRSADSSAKDKPPATTTAEPVVLQGGRSPVHPAENSVEEPRPTTLVRRMASGEIPEATPRRRQEQASSRQEETGATPVTPPSGTFFSLLPLPIHERTSAMASPVDPMLGGVPEKNGPARPPDISLPDLERTKSEDVRAVGSHKPISHPPLAPHLAGAVVGEPPAAAEDRVTMACAASVSPASQLFGINSDGKNHLAISESPTTHMSSDGDHSIAEQVDTAGATVPMPVRTVPVQTAFPSAVPVADKRELATLRLSASQSPIPQSMPGRDGGNGSGEPMTRRGEYPAKEPIPEMVAETPTVVGRSAARLAAFPAVLQDTPRRDDGLMSGLPALRQTGDPVKTSAHAAATAVELPPGPPPIQPALRPVATPDSSRPRSAQDAEREEKFFRGPVTSALRPLGLPLAKPTSSDSPSVEVSGADLSEDHGNAGQNARDIATHPHRHPELPAPSSPAEPAKWFVQIHSPESMPEDSGNTVVTAPARAGQNVFLPEGPQQHESQRLPLHEAPRSERGGAITYNQPQATFRTDRSANPPYLSLPHETQQMVNAEQITIGEGITSEFPSSEASGDHPQVDPPTPAAPKEAVSSNADETSFTHHPTGTRIFPLEKRPSAAGTSPPTAFHSARKTWDVSLPEKLTPFPSKNPSAPTRHDVVTPGGQLAIESTTAQNVAEATIAVENPERRPVPPTASGHGPFTVHLVNEAAVVAPILSAPPPPQPSKSVGGETFTPPVRPELTATRDRVQFGSVMTEALTLPDRPVASATTVGVSTAVPHTGAIRSEISSSKAEHFRESDREKPARLATATPLSPASDRFPESSHAARRDGCDVPVSAPHAIANCENVRDDAGDRAAQEPSLRPARGEALVSASPERSPSPGGIVADRSASISDAPTAPTAGFLGNENGSLSLRPFDAPRKYASERSPRIENNLRSPQPRLSELPESTVIHRSSPPLLPDERLCPSLDLSEDSPGTAAQSTAAAVPTLVSDRHQAVGKGTPPRTTETPRASPKLPKPAVSPARRLSSHPALKETLASPNAEPTPVLKRRVDAVTVGPVAARQPPSGMALVPAAMAGRHPAAMQDAAIHEKSTDTNEKSTDTTPSVTTVSHPEPIRVAIGEDLTFPPVGTLHNEKTRLEATDEHSEGSERSLESHLRSALQESDQPHPDRVNSSGPEAAIPVPATGDYPAAAAGIIARRVDQAGSNEESAGSFAQPTPTRPGNSRMVPHALPVGDSQTPVSESPPPAAASQIRADASSGASDITPAPASRGWMTNSSAPKSMVGGARFPGAPVHFSPPHEPTRQVSEFQSGHETAESLAAGAPLVTAPASSSLSTPMSVIQLKRQGGAAPPLVPLGGEMPLAASDTRSTGAAPSQAPAVPHLQYPTDGVVSESSAGSESPTPALPYVLAPKGGFRSPVPVDLPSHFSVRTPPAKQAPLRPVPISTHVSQPSGSTPKKVLPSGSLKASPFAFSADEKRTADTPGVIPVPNSFFTDFPAGLATVRIVPSPPTVRVASDQSVTAPFFHEQPTSAPGDSTDIPPGASPCLRGANEIVSRHLRGPSHTQHPSNRKPLDGGDPMDSMSQPALFTAKHPRSLAGLHGMASATVSAAPQSAPDGSPPPQPPASSSAAGVSFLPLQEHTENGYSQRSVPHPEVAATAPIVSPAAAGRARTGSPQMPVLFPEGATTVQPSPAVLAARLPAAAGPESSKNADPVVRVTIGRLRIDPAKPAPVPARRVFRRPAPSLTLAKYLANKISGR